MSINGKNKKKITSRKVSLFLILFSVICCIVLFIVPFENYVVEGWKILCCCLTYVVFILNFLNVKCKINKILFTFFIINYSTITFVSYILGVNFGYILALCLLVIVLIVDVFILIYSIKDVYLIPSKNEENITSLSNEKMIRQLKELKMLLDEHIITEDEFKQKRTKYLNDCIGGDNHD